MKLSKPTSPPENTFYSSPFSAGSGDLLPFSSASIAVSCGGDLWSPFSAGERDLDLESILGFFSSLLSSPLSLLLDLLGDLFSPRDLERDRDFESRLDLERERDLDLLLDLDFSFLTLAERDLDFDLDLL